MNPLEEAAQALRDLGYGQTEARKEDAERNEGMPGTWSHCHSSKKHGPHRHTVTFNEGPYHNILCKGTPGDSDGSAPLGRLVYD